MNSEEMIRDALHRAAARHHINPTLPPSTSKRARLRRSLAVIGVGVVAFSVVVGGLGIARYLDNGEPRLAPASGPSPEASEESPAGSPLLNGAPLVLITEEGWRVNYVDQYPGDKVGEMEFRDESHRLELMWRPASFHDDFVRDRAAGATAHGTIRILGQDAVLYQYDGATDYTALWLYGDFSMELRGVFASVDEFKAVASTLESVDEETWLAAMPEGVVAPSERAAVVDEMLADIPVPERVDLEQLKAESIVSDRYQLGAVVTGAVACGWIEQWIEAKDKGDDGSAREAVDAMATSREWAILLEMKDDGGWSPVVWQYADAIAANDPDIARVGIQAGDEKPQLAYEAALGCDRKG